MSDRDATIQLFLNTTDYAKARRTALAGDASARRYERLRRDDGKTAILVETPTPDADLLPFITVGRILATAGFSVPRVLAARPSDGLAVLEDFGDATFSRLLDDGADPDPLFADATDILIALHRRIDDATTTQSGLPAYTAPVFARQVSLFLDTYLPVALGPPISTKIRDEFAEAWRTPIAEACAGPRSLLLRDYFAGNLMRLARPGLARVGIIDFQSAGPGPVAYDLVSLLEDARRDLPVGLASRMVDRYLDAFPDLDADAFRRSYAVLGAVRHTRIVGIFTRLAVKEHRRGYLVHLPRVWRLLEAKLKEPALAAVARWFDQYLPPDVRECLIVPEAD